MLQALNVQSVDIVSTVGAKIIVNRKRFSTVRAGPLLSLMLKESIHTFFSDHSQILKWRLPVWVLRCIPAFLLHDILTGKIRTFIAVLISVFPPLPAENNPTVFRAELRLMIIRPVAALTGIILNQGHGTNVTVQPTGGDHFRFKQCAHSFTDLNCFLMYSTRFLSIA